MKAKFLSRKRRQVLTAGPGHCEQQPGRSPGVIFIDWLRRFYDYFTSTQVVAADLLQHASPEDPAFGAGYARVLDPAGLS